MLTFLDAYIMQLCIHKTGNRNMDEGYSLSKAPTEIRDKDERTELLKFFTGSFQGNEFFNFTSPIGLTGNNVYNVAKSFFNDETELYDASVDITKLLYQESNHPKISGGEVYVVFMKGVQYFEEEVEALGIFKSENKAPFMKIENNGEVFDYKIDEGINLAAIDKACLILRTNEDEGYRVCIRDHQNKGEEAVYWKQEFLGLEATNDSYHKTKEFMAMCKDYVTDVLPQQFEVARTEQIDLLNKSVSFFKTNEQFDYESFTREVMQEPQIIESFNNFKKDYEDTAPFDFNDGFDISGVAVKKQSKIFKSILKLDKTFHVYIHGNLDMIERGYDDERRMNFYKLYYNDEA